MIPYAISIPGGWEWMVILLIVLIVFGAGRLPQVFEAFGKSIKSFRDAQKEDPRDVSDPQQIPGGDGLSEAHEVGEKHKAGR